MKSRTWMLWLLIFAFGLLPTALSAQGPTYWNLALQSDPRLPNGKMAAVKGQTNQSGVHFQLKGLAITQPAAIQLVSVDPSYVLELRAFKDDPANPLETRRTDSRGLAQLHFRTGETIYFRITGTGMDLIEYKLVVFVGDKITIPDSSDYFVSPKGEKTVIGNIQGKSKIADSEDAGDVLASNTRSDSETSGFQVTLIVLLGLILVALVVLLVVLIKRKPKAAVVILLAIALMPDINLADEKTVPKPIYTLMTDEEVENFRSQMKFGKLKKFNERHKNDDAFMRNFVEYSILAKDILELFNIIDGKEKLVMADLSPRGMPKLPSSYKGDANPSSQKIDRFKKINNRIQAAHKFLENNFVVYKQTMITANRIKKLQQAAANVSTFSQLALMIHGGDTPGEKIFNDKYDRAVQNGLDYLDQALKEMSEFEDEVYGFDNWYVYYGIQFYNFMLKRYFRE